MTVKAQYDKYAIFLEKLTTRGISELKDFVAEDVIFIDPFHKANGVKEMSKIFIKLFEKVKNIKFKIGKHALNGTIVYFNWKLSGSLSGKPWTVEGITRLRFNKKMQIIEHREYWDAATQVYEQFPFIGPLLRYLRRRIAS